ncbi:MAG: hypothetical protein WB814_04085, partial [Candidatus Sulfotelmatobacter sp.]
GKNVMAKVPAHVVELQTPAPNDAAVTRVDGGQKTLAGVRFAGTKTALDISGATTSMESSGSSQ